MIRNIPNVILQLLKNCFRNSVLIFISALILVFGNSVNIWHFCCDVCRNNAVEVVSTGNCRHFQEQDNHKKSKAAQSLIHSRFCNGECPADMGLDEESCYEEHYCMTLDDQVFIPHIKPILQISTLFVLPINLWFNEPESFFQNKNLYTGIFPPLGREILRSICILRC